MKKYFTVKNGLDSVEAIGVIMLVLIILAIASVRPEWSLYSPTVFVSFEIMLALIIGSAISSLGRLAAVWNNERYMMVVGLLLLLAGGVVIVLLPEFFHTMKGLPYSYWHRVSLYSMPAVCIEGGLFSLFRVYLVHAAGERTSREHGMLFGGFLLYASAAVAVNFMALGNTISVTDQLLFSRVIVYAALFVIAAVYWYRTTPSPRLL